MKLSQNKENIFIKGLDEADAQVLSIVKRYFENNPEELWSSIDGIITEVLRRVKEDLISGKLTVSVTSVNGKTGQVELKPEDVFAEPTIKDKKTAFNKDFGITEDSVCRGNDPRLSDAREPLSHEHSGYIKTDEINSYIRKFLTDNGLEFLQESIILKNKDFVLDNGIFMEAE